MDGVIGCDLLDRFAAIDRLHGGPGLELGLWVRRLLIGGSPFQGRYPDSAVNDGACPENKYKSALHPLRIIKLQIGFQKTRFRGMLKISCKVNTLTAHANLFMARHRLLCKT